MIKELTPEQKSRFAEFVDKWTKIGLSTEPADHIKAEQGIKLIYGAANLKEPKIVWCTSPLANGLTRAVVQKLIKDKKVGDSVWDSVWASVRASVRDSVRASVRDSVWASVRASVRDSVWDSVWASVRASVWASVWDSVWASVRASVRDSVWDSVRASVGDSVGDSVWASVRASVRDSVRASVRDSVWASVRASVGASGYGQHDANWLAFYEYFKTVCGLNKETEKLAGLWLQAQSAGWYIPHKNICWVCERHNVVKLNKRGRLHCENGMALSYPDGWGIYALNGIRVKPEYILTPAADLKPETVLQEKSVDVRRELLRKIGVMRMLSFGKIKEESGDYKLVDMSPVFAGIRYAPHLLMKNPSVKDTWHLEGVSPSCETIQQAINWRAGNIKIEWSPAQLS